MVTSRRDPDDRRTSARGRAETHKSVTGSSAITIPDGIKKIEINSEDVRRFIFVTYKAGTRNPFCGEGIKTHELTYFQHRQIGPNLENMICNAKTLKKKCFVCEKKAALRNSDDFNDEIKKLVDALSWKERQLFLVFDCDKPKDGLQVWDYSYHLFGKQMDNRIKASDEDEGYEFFADKTDGLLVKIAFTAKSMQGGKEFYEASSIDFKKRPADVDIDELYKSAINLEDCLNVMTYEQGKALFLQLDEEEGGDEEPTKRKPTAKEEDDDEPAPQKKKPAVVEEEDEDPEPAPKKKKPAPPADEDDEEPVRKKAKAVVEEEVDEDEVPPPKKKKPAPVEDEEDAEPAPKKKKPAAVEEDDDEPAPKKKKPAPVADEDDEEPAPKKKKPAPVDDEDEEPAPKKKKPAVVEEEDDTDWDDFDDTK